MVCSLLGTELQPGPFCLKCSFRLFLLTLDHLNLSSELSPEALLNPPRLDVNLNSFVLLCAIHTYLSAPPPPMATLY